MRILCRTASLVLLPMLCFGLTVPLANAAGVRHNAVVATSPFWAVKRVVIGFLPHSGKTHACKAFQGNYALCPMTTRMKKRANQLGKLQANPICRCQNMVQVLTIGYANRHGATATVATRWNFGGSTEDITFITVRTTGMSSWQVDDSYCTGRPNTSLYKPPRGSCG